MAFDTYTGKVYLGASVDLPEGHVVYPGRADLADAMSHPDGATVEDITTAVEAVQAHMNPDRARTLTQTVIRMAAKY